MQFCNCLFFFVLFDKIYLYTVHRSRCVHCHLLVAHRLLHFLRIGASRLQRHFPPHSEDGEIVDMMSTDEDVGG